MDLRQRTCARRCPSPQGAQERPRLGPRATRRPAVTATPSTRTFVRIALMAALVAALGFVPPVYLPFTLGVPISLQTMGVMLAGLILGAQAGALSLALFCLVVLLGAPLLAGGRGGLGVLFGPTAGFFLGFVPGAFVTGLLARRLPFPPLASGFLAALAGGVLVLYGLGIPGLALIGHLDLGKAALASLAFLPGDILKAIAAALLARAVKARLPDDPLAP